MSTPPPLPPVDMEWWKMALGLIAAGAAWAWRFVTGDIRELRKTTVTKNEFDKHVEHVKEVTEDAQKQRDELRQGIIDLYQGQKEMTADINAKHIELLEMLHRLELKK